MNAILKYMPFYGLKLQNKDSKIPEEMQTFKRDNIFLPRFFFSFKYPWQLSAHHLDHFIKWHDIE